MVASAPLLLALLALLAPAPGDATATALRANPIRKVVTMLQDMQKSVEEEGEKQADLFDKFMCYCQNGEGALEASISTAKANIEQLSAEVERDTAEKSQLEQDVAQHKADREEAEKSMKEATAMREKEAAEFAASSGDMKSNLQSMDGALAALKKGLGAALLQTGMGDMLRNIVKSSPAVREGERSALLSFLESGSEVEGGSDQIIGIVEQMKETMEADLKESEGAEAEAKATFESLMTSKTSETAAAGKAIESKMARTGKVAVEIVQGGADLKSTESAVAEDEQFKANLKKNCATKGKEEDERIKLQAQEVVAISDTIKMLSDDDALELFKKTLPSAAASASAFIQTSVRSRSQVHRAKDLIQRAMSADKGHSIHRNLLLAALRSHSGGFEKVVGMVDGMVGVLEGEQVQDDTKDVWCLAELEKAREERKATEVEVGDLEASIEEQKDEIATVTSEIEALKAGLVDLDKSVAEATEQRKKEHQESIDTAAGNTAAVELLGMAKNRMNKFYNPTLYKEPEKTEEELVQEGPISFLQYRKSEGSASIIQMMDDMIRDVEKDIAEGKRDEEEAQKDYEEAMNDSATKRSDDSKLVVTKEGEKAEKTTNYEEDKEAKRTKSGALDVMETKIQDLHKTCDLLVEQYKKIREERGKEEEGLKASKMVLAGAKLSFLQY